MRLFHVEISTVKFRSFFFVLTIGRCHKNFFETKPPKQLRISNYDRNISGINISNRSNREEDKLRSIHGHVI